MCGVIVVDAGRSRSTCRDAYIHDHCLRYHYYYSLLYQLANNNLFTHCMLSSREKPLMKSMAPGLSKSYIKIQKYIASLLFTSLYLCFYLSIYHYDISSLQLTAEGLTTPCLRWVQVFVNLCVGIANEVLRGSPTRLIVLVIN